MGHHIPPPDTTTGKPQRTPGKDYLGLVGVPSKEQGVVSFMVLSHWLKPRWILVSNN